MTAMELILTILVVYVIGVILAAAFYSGFVSRSRVPSEYYDCEIIAALWPITVPVIVFGAFLQRCLDLGFWISSFWGKK